MWENVEEEANEEQGSAGRRDADNVASTSRLVGDAESYTRGSRGRDVRSDRHLIETVN